MGDVTQAMHCMGHISRDMRAACFGKLFYVNETLIDPFLKMSNAVVNETYERRYTHPPPCEKYPALHHVTGTG